MILVKYKGKKYVFKTREQADKWLCELTCGTNMKVVEKG